MKKSILNYRDMFLLRAALDKSDTAPLLTEDVMGTLGAFGPYAGFFGLLVISLIKWPYHSHCCRVVLTVIIALKTSASQRISHIFHPSNELVVGPGCYCFIDYEGRCHTDTHHVAGVDGDYTCFPAIDVMNSSRQNQSD